jgi:hypothetical protein
MLQCVVSITRAKEITRTSNVHKACDLRQLFLTKDSNTFVVVPVEIFGLLKSCEEHRYRTCSKFKNRIVFDKLKCF